MHVRGCGHVHMWVWRGMYVSRSYQDRFCTWHRYILQLFHLFEDSAPFLSKAPAMPRPLQSPSRSFDFSVPASVSSPSSVFFLYLHLRTRPVILEPSLNVCPLHPCDLFLRMPSPPRSLALSQEVPTALRVHLVPDRNEDGFYCMTNSKHSFFC